MTVTDSNLEAARRDQETDTGEKPGIDAEDLVARLRQQVRREEVRALAEQRGLDLADECVRRGAWAGCSPARDA